MEIDRHLRQQLQNKEIPLGEILKRERFYKSVSVGRGS